MRAALLSLLVACGSSSSRSDAAETQHDARIIDAVVDDAQVADGQLVDGPLVDGPLVDAAMIDAAMIDAAMIDAALPDAHLVDAALPDAAVMPDAASGMTVHVTGVVDNLAGATVQSAAGTAITDANGSFSLDVASGTQLIMRASTGDTAHLHMIRGVVAQANMRTRHFNLVTTAQLSAMSALGVTFDPTKAIVEVNFLHAQSGGYGAKLLQNGSMVTPQFGVADSGGDYVLATTTQTAFATSVLLANLPPGSTQLEGIAPTSATLKCHRVDLDPIPLEANTVTWVDFECGTDPTP